MITIELNDGKKIEIDDDGIRITDKQNSIEIASSSGEIAISATSKLSLKAPQIAIEATASLELKGGPSLSASATQVRIN